VNLSPASMHSVPLFGVMVVPGFQLSMHEFTKNSEKNPGMDTLPVNSRGDLHSTSIPYESSKTSEEPLNYTPLDENKMNSSEATHLQAP
ncbi:hypothetical protein Tco_0177409, partial [Tanacetum coccineum]